MNEPKLSEEEIRQLQAELDRISVEDVIIQTVVTLLNVGARKSGLGDPTAPVELQETKLAIDAARALLPLLEERHGEQLAPIKDMIAQLQVAYAQKAGSAGESPGEGGPEAAEGAPGGAEPAAEPPPSAQSSGRLWVPGQ